MDQEKIKQCIEINHKKLQYFLYHAIKEVESKQQQDFMKNLPETYN